MQLAAGLTLTTFVAFCGVAVALILTPGPDTMYVLARGMQGRATGVRSALGISTGVLLHTAAAALGLAALLRAAPTAYRVVKYAGALYLVYLGLTALRDDEFDPAVQTDADGSFRRGVLVNALNPKVALFFLSLLPTFAGSGSGAELRMFLLGGTYASLTALYLSGVAVASGRIGRLLESSRFSSGLSWLGGGVMVALGVGVAVE
ncbi:LysE family translocator [Halogeometricum limi]|uniref:Threonine/homoserine/homoserine lactone efflux protein n=1 Tax=Halogeometricum limi TaxID=555875 RepID=A0A1I6FT75_9EURY|nr:LysE family translocator [Halogeometricum limi]SFR33116.1 Threonine/homoserine/homoserine lactone efflux protein [Halogeometricum limi]